MCKKGDNEDLLLLCDGCDKGCHTYCHKPKITSIPEGDWYCPACISKVSVPFFSVPMIRSCLLRTNLIRSLEKKVLWQSNTYFCHEIAS